MARTGWGAANFLRYAAGVVTAAPFTMSIWAKTPSIVTDQHLIGLFTSGSAYNRNSFRIQIDGATGLLRFSIGDASSGTQADSAAAVTADTWFHACAVETSVTSHAIFLNGANKGTDATSKTPSGINRTSIGLGDGSVATNAFSSTGNLAWAAIWNAALSDAEVAILAKGAFPFLVRPASIVGVWPILGNNSPENNRKSNTSVLSVQGTLTKIAGPRIFMPKRKFLMAA